MDRNNLLKKNKLYYQK